MPMVRPISYPTLLIVHAVILARCTTRLNNLLNSTMLRQKFNSDFGTTRVKSFQRVYSYHPNQSMSYMKINFCLDCRIITYILGEITWKYTPSHFTRFKFFLSRILAYRARPKPILTCRLLLIEFHNTLPLENYNFSVLHHLFRIYKQEI